MDSNDILSHISKHFHLFDDYMILHSIQMIEDLNDEYTSISVKFDFISFDNINTDLDVDESIYFSTLELIERHFKACSFNILEFNSNINKISFNSKYKEFIYKKKSNSFCYKENFIDAFV